MSVSRNVSVLSPEYRRFIQELKTRVLSARISAARAVNRELILLYWDIGRGIVERQRALGWGDAVVEMVATDLRRAFPGMRGFSPSNVWRMRQFFLLHGQPEFLAQAARELGDDIREHGPEQILAQVARELSKEGKMAPNTAELSQIVREMVAVVPWGHHANALAKVTDPAARLYYLRAAALPERRDS